MAKTILELTLGTKVLAVGNAVPAIKDAAIRSGGISRNAMMALGLPKESCIMLTQGVLKKRLREK